MRPILKFQAFSPPAKYIRHNNKDICIIYTAEIVNIFTYTKTVIVNTNVRKSNKQGKLPGQR